MSGTIPSMETASNELKDNTIVISALSFINPRPDLARKSSDFHETQSLEPPVISPRRRCVRVSSFVLQMSGR